MSSRAAAKRFQIRVARPFQSHVSRGLKAPRYINMENAPGMWDGGYGMNVNFAWPVMLFVKPSSDSAKGRVRALMRT